jgi:hypothetical protein
VAAPQKHTTFNHHHTIKQMYNIQTEKPETLIGTDTLSILADKQL